MVLANLPDKIQILIVVLNAVFGGGRSTLDLALQAMIPSTGVWWRASSLPTWPYVCTGRHWKVLKTAQRITGSCLPIISDIYSIRCRKKSYCIMRDSTHATLPHQGHDYPAEKPFLPTCCETDKFCTHRTISDNITTCVNAFLHLGHLVYFQDFHSLIPIPTLLTLYLYLYIYLLGFIFNGVVLCAFFLTLLLLLP